MNLQEFNINFGNLKDKDLININCDFSEHVGDRNKTMPKVSAKRNILKNNSSEFICRDCTMKHKNPMNNKGAVKRQTDEEILVICPDDRHQGDKSRKMKMSGYFGKLEQPYVQTCKSCAQLDKIISEEQKNKISLKLTGIKRTEEFKKKLRDYIHAHPERLAQIKKTLTEKRGSGMLGKHHSEETKNKMSEIMSGRTYSDEHKQNISEGRKKMLDAQGGLLKETREKLSKATIQQYINGFDPKTNHVRGDHFSSKCDKIMKFKSSYEKKAFMKLDADDNVLKYEYESTIVEYINPLKGITGSYLVDLLVYYKDGTKKLIEVKPNSWLRDPVVVAKIEAAYEYAKSMGITFEVWEEMTLFGHVYNEKNMRSFCQKIKDEQTKKKF
jgi:hypothetical protein